ncbi:MAG: YbaN family protein [Pseudomonadota bacterium]|nr:YbaN family protein [Pseudomonadota bacterium]
MVGNRDQTDTKKRTLSSRDGPHIKPLVRFFLIGFGWLNVGFAAVGVVVPGIPTTIFLLIALWAFSQSSDRLRSWLYNHPIFGAFLQDWKKHGVIPKKAKIAAISVMFVSWVFLISLSANWMIWGSAGLVMMCVAGFIATRPSVPRGD